MKRYIDIWVMLHMWVMWVMSHIQVSVGGGGAENDNGVRSSKERMAEVYRESLELKRRAMNAVCVYT